MDIYGDLGKLKRQVSCLNKQVDNLSNEPVVVSPDQAILNQETAAQDASFWVQNSPHSLKFDSKGLTAISGFTWNEDLPRLGLDVSTNNYNLQRPYTFRSDKAGNGDFQRGPLVDIQYAYGGPIGPTVWGNNVIWPQRQALAATSKVCLDNDTYTLEMNNTYGFGSLVAHTQLGSSNNDVNTPLDITMGSTPESGMYGVFTRMDLWPGHAQYGDTGVSTKHYRGWLNLYSSIVMYNGGPGSTIDRLNFYVAGKFVNEGLAANLTISDMMGYYVQPMKTASVVNAWGVYQEGVDDKNYFGGNVLIGSTTDSGEKLQVTGNVKVIGDLSLSADPSADDHAVRKGFLDTQIAGLIAKSSLASITPIADPATATLEDVANKINEILTALQA